MGRGTSIFITQYFQNIEFTRKKNYEICYFMNNQAFLNIAEWLSTDYAKELGTLWPSFKSTICKKVFSGGRDK